MNTHPEEVLRHLVSRIAGRAMRTYRWGVATDDEKDQVPLHWVGDPAVAPFFGAQPKSAGPPTIPRFEKWLRRRAGAEIVEGEGDHRKARLPGVPHPVDYDTGAGFLLRPESKQFASVLALKNIVDLYQHVAEMKSPRATAAAE